MAQVIEKPASYEDLLGVPGNLVAEIIHGHLYTSPRPAPRHARAASSLGAKINPPFDLGDNGPGGWWILDEPELHLDEDVFVPDLAGWRRERMPQLPDTAWFELPPDWICEVLSPSTERIDRAEKMPRYAHHGVKWLWLVDPDIKTLEAFELHDGQWLLLETLADDAMVRLPPFDAAEFPLSALWA
ncbi:MAG: Uma2 family endonuclease [Gammaproteobacteria bacterium]|nr:MAG: Uma2 family endonuclease [Gammaproteobacteria bacterium]RTZ76005.1 MAG: Uma2 family endonuclease [Gammaproteobacteria bacterium]